MEICCDFPNFVKYVSFKTANSDTVSTYQVSSVQLVTDKKLEAFNKAKRLLITKNLIKLLIKEEALIKEVFNNRSQRVLIKRFFYFSNARELQENVCITNFQHFKQPPIRTFFQGIVSFVHNHFF